MEVKEQKTMNADQKLAHMADAIDSGGSAFYGGRVISSKADLPSKAELAVTEGERQAAQADIQSRRKALDAEEARLRISSESDVLLPDERKPASSPAPQPPPAKPAK